MNRLTLAGSIAAASAFGGHAAGDDDMRRGLNVGSNCFGTCENGSEREGVKWWDPTTLVNPCTCEAGSNWGGPCCDSRLYCDGSFICPRYLLKEASVSVNDLAVDGVWQDIGPRVGRAGGPEDLPTNLQGIFWLTYQADSSALLSFAQSPKEDNAALKHDDDAFAIRVAGDRTWAFADDAAPWELVDEGDLVYHFKDATEEGQPSFYNIIPESRRAAGLAMAEWLLNFDMEEMTEEQVMNHPLNPCGPTGCTGSVVWDRTSDVFGYEVTSKEYLLTQVVDGNGNTIEPAWSKFVEQQNGETVGGSPGTVHYRYTD